MKYPEDSKVIISTLKRIEKKVDNIYIHQKWLEDINKWRLKISRLEFLSVAIFTIGLASLGISIQIQHTSWIWGSLGILIIGLIVLYTSILYQRWVPPPQIGSSGPRVVYVDVGDD